MKTSSMKALVVINEGKSVSCMLTHRITIKNGNF
jgi:hypothetical protein